MFQVEIFETRFRKASSKVLGEICLIRLHFMLLEGAGGLVGIVYTCFSGWLASLRKQ